MSLKPSSRSVVSRCRLCDEPEREPFLHLEHAPANISRLLQREDFGKDPPIDLQVWRCRVCGFVQIDPVLADDYYDEYLMTVSHSAQMRRYQQAQAEAFVERFELRGRQVLEVGCGDGNYLLYLKGAGARVSGNEPSARFRQLALEKGFTVHPGYVQADAPVPGGPYDAVATRQVLEHVPDPHDFILGLRRSLVPGGAVLVEVPSLEQAMEGHRFYDFFSDHLNYFTARTLRFALERVGFEVLETSRGMNGEFNVALAKVASDFEFQGFDGKVSALLGELRGWVEAVQARGGRVAVWGAGGKGLATMAVARLRGIAYVVDSDPHKQGRFTPVTHFPVVPPERLRDEPVDALVLGALAYREEILRDLRGRLGFRGPVVVLGTRLEVLEGEGG
jgi:SAM-dependent methyltransferase